RPRRLRGPHETFEAHAARSGPRSGEPVAGVPARPREEFAARLPPRRGGYVDPIAARAARSRDRRRRRRVRRGAPAAAIEEAAHMAKRRAIDPRSDARCRVILERGVKTPGDLKELMSAVIADLATGRITPSRAN